MFVPYWILDKFTEDGREPVDMLDILSSDVCSDDIVRGSLSDQDIYTIQNLNGALDKFNRYFNDILSTIDCWIPSNIKTNKAAVEYLATFFSQLESNTNCYNEKPFKIIPVVGYRGGNRYIIQIENGFEKVFKGDRELIKTLSEDILDKIGKYEGLKRQCCNPLFERYIRSQ